MPPPIAVELSPHDPTWAEWARAEGSLLMDALDDSLVAVHHIGSTAIPGIRAKPILDLISVFASPPALDETRGIIESLGYTWWGEYGLTGRRYYTWDDRLTGRRRVQLHGYLIGSAEIARHLAFRDFLLARPEVAWAYDAEKARCRDLYPFDSHAYSDCKCNWIQTVQAEALQSQLQGPLGST